MNNENSNTGYRVIDPEGGAHEYPQARNALVDRGDLVLNDANHAAVAIFHRWEHVERIVKTEPAFNITITAPEMSPEQIAEVARRFGV